MNGKYYNHICEIGTPDPPVIHCDYPPLLIVSLHATSWGPHSPCWHSLLLTASNRLHLTVEAMKREGSSGIEWQRSYGIGVGKGFLMLTLATS